MTCSEHDMPGTETRLVYVMIRGDEAEVLHPDAADVCKRLALRRVFAVTELSKYTHSLTHAGYKVFCVKQSRL